VRASKARSTGNLDNGGDEFESQNRPKQETTGGLTKTSLEAMSVRYGKKSMGVVGLSGGAVPALSTYYYRFWRFHYINPFGDLTASHRPDVPVVHGSG